MSCMWVCYMCASLNTDSQCYDDVASHMKKLKLILVKKIAIDGLNDFLQVPVQYLPSHI